MRVEVKYTTEIITRSTTIKPDGFSCISFENIGESNARLLDNIPLEAGGPVRNFKNDPEQIIRTDIQVVFSEPGKETKVLIVKTYYYELYS